MKKIALLTFLFFFVLACETKPHSKKENTTKKSTTSVTENKIDNTNQKLNKEIITIDTIDVSEVIKDEIIVESKLNKEKTPNLTQNKTTAPKTINSTDTKLIDNKLNKTVVEDVVKIKKPNHLAWDELLRKNVNSSGKVNYSAMKSSLLVINGYIKQLESFTSQKDWSRNEKLAYWINLYNAATVRLIVENNIPTSITKINGGKPWDKKVVNIGTKSYSLNQIENDIIRPKFKEPRIHFAVNCAAKSCPKIMNSAFMPDKLSSQLTKQAKAFINGNKNNISANSVQISKIFEWYAADFGNSVIDYLNKYSTTKIDAKATISYKEYDWDLNK